MIPLEMSDYQSLMLMGTFISYFGGMVYAAGKFANALKSHEELIKKFGASLSALREESYLLSHKEAREYLHKHTAECKTITR